MMGFRLLLVLLFIPYSNGFLWLPFANLGSMFETLKQTAFQNQVDLAEPESAYNIIELGREFLHGIGNFITSSFGDEEKMSLASNLREIFNLTTEVPKTTKRFRPKIIPVDRPSTTTPSPVQKIFTMPYTTPHFFTTTTTVPEITSTYDPKPNFRFTTTTEPVIVKFVKTPRPEIPSTFAPSETDTIKTTADKMRYATFAPNIQFTASPPTTEPTTTTSTTTSTTTTTTPVTTTTPTPTTTTTPFAPHRVFTKPYPIWPTTTRSFPTELPYIPPTHERLEATTSSIFSLIRPTNMWRKITPSILPEHTTSVIWSTEMPATDLPDVVQTNTPVMETFTDYPSTTAGIPFIIKAKKFTRPPINEKISVTATPVSSKYDTCLADQRCSIKLKSFETSDPLFQYCYSHSTMIEESIQDLLRDTQTAVLPVHINWRQSVTPEVVQFVQTLMSLYRPSRCLVVGVFTGLGLIGIAEKVDSRGIVVALEHPAYSVFWDKVGLKHAKKLKTAQMSRIQMRTSESIEKSLPRLAANEPNTFDFVFLDDFKRENYLDDYEHSVRLLRSGGLLIINQALNGGGVMSPIDYMTNDDKVIRNMNIRIKQDSRVSASLLPYGGGTWIVTKN